MKHPKFSRSFEIVAELPEPLQALRKLAENFRWTWHSDTRDLFHAVDKDQWESSERNPFQMVSSITPEKAQRLLDDDIFMAKLRACEKDLEEYLSANTWFDKTYPGQRDKATIAYFCAEFGISESLPIYSGGLGVLAGDHLKAASDLGIPLVAVGLLYNRGYFRQRLSFDGWQKEHYPQYDFYQFPIQLLRGDGDKPLRIEVELPDRVVTAQVWKAMVGRISLYLLDSNVLENSAADQGITDNLYGGNEEMRIRQEMILGIGGLRALRAAGIQPTVCHMNEGHAAFLSVERIRQFMQDNKTDFRTARQVVVSGNVFTTHTPVPAGFDLFTPEILKRYMGKMVEGIGMPLENFLSLGRIEKDNEGEAFNMAVLAMETANHVNGVAKLHAKVTREMFQRRWPGYPEDEVPVQAITNGVHTVTWTSRRMAKLFDEHLGKEWRRMQSDPELWKKVANIPDADLWAVREDQRGDLVRFARRRLQVDLERRNQGKPDFNMLGQILDPRVLTIGFARRFATYKRATLMMQDPERLKKILYHPERPVQIVIAGKAHPRDEAGKKLIQDLVHFISEGGARTRMVFLEDYDMRVARAMVQGVDLWLNNPRRPMEASGTSGMKVLPNGGLNCSVLDGWWDEGFDNEVGWAIGDREEQADDGHQNWLDSRSLYSLLENEIAPKFYHRVDNGLPKLWLEMMKSSMMKLGPYFSTSRMVQQYTDDFYMPAAWSFQRLIENNLERAKSALEWRTRIRKSWSNVRVLKSEDDAKNSNLLGKKIKVRALVQLGDLDPKEVKVQTIVGQVGPNREIVESEAIDMSFSGNGEGGAWFEAIVAMNKPGYRGYTVRVLPYHENVNVASELSLVAWQPAD